MYCSKCGSLLNGNENFCHNCGNKVQIITKETFEHNNISNEVQNQQNNIQNSNDNISKNGQNNLNNNHLKLFQILNYKTMYEKVLVILNSILYGFMIYYLTMSFGLVLLAVIADALLMVFIVSFGGEPFTLTAQALTSFVKNIPILGILSLILILVNGIMWYLMYKNNENLNVGFKVNKLKYLLVTYFFGICGVHRFMIKDKQGGIFRLILIGISFLVVIIGSLFDISIIGYLHLLLIGCVFGLNTTDFVIALAKKSDNEKNIFV